MQPPQKTKKHTAAAEKKANKLLSDVSNLTPLEPTISIISGSGPPATTTAISVDDFLGAAKSIAPQLVSLSESIAEGILAGNGIDKPSAPRPVTPLAISGQGPPAAFYSDLISVLGRVASGIEHLVSNGIKGAFLFFFQP